MAIPGYQVINVGLPNESTGSDSLYDAFNKTKNNFSQLFTYASPYNTFVANTGIGITANSTTGTVNITNTGVTNIVAGTNIVINQSNGDVTISSTGGGNGGGGLSSVGVTSSTLTVTNTPLVVNGNINVNLPSIANVAGTYTYPTVTVDSFGRITSIANANSVGTVTSVGLNPGLGIQISGGPITSNGNITVTNTGVTRLNAGTGIQLSSSNGNVTISSTGGGGGGGTVSSVGINSSTLSVSGSPILSSGVMVVDLPANVTASRFISNVATGTAPFTVSSTTKVANLSVETANTATTATTATTAGTVTTAAQPNITSVGTLTSVSVSGNANVGNLNATNISGTLTTNSQPNITSLGTLSTLTVSGNSSLGANSNVRITGGTTGQVLSTDGSGNLSWLTPSTGNPNEIINGNSSVNIPVVDGNVNIQVESGDQNYWIDTYGEWGNGQSGADGSAIDSNGNVFVIGTVRNLSLGPSVDQGIIRKFSPTGQLLYEKAMPYSLSTTDTPGACVVIDSSDNVYGLFVVNGTPNVYNLLIKFDNNLNLQWSNRIGETGTALSGAQCLMINASNQIFFGTYDGYVVSTDGSGTLLWTKQHPLGTGVRIQCLVDMGDGILVGTGNENVTVWKLSYAGNALWTNNISTVQSRTTGVGWDGTNWYVQGYEYIAKVSGADNSTVLWQKSLQSASSNMENYSNIYIQNGNVYVGGWHNTQWPGDTYNEDSIGLVSLNSSTGNLVFVNSVVCDRSFVWWWWGLQPLAVRGNVGVITGYGVPYADNVYKWITASLPLNNSVPNNTRISTPYVDNTAASTATTVTGSAGTGYNGSPSAWSSVTPNTNTTPITPVSPSILNTDVKYFINYTDSNWNFNKYEANTSSTLELYGTDTQIASYPTNVKNPISIDTTTVLSTATYWMYLAEGNTKYYTSNPTANFILNLTYSQAAQLNDVMNTGDIITYTVIVRQGSTPYKLNGTNGLVIDTVIVTARWKTGAVPNAVANSSSVYTFRIIKTAEFTFDVIADMESYS